jgi:phosphoribosylformimino-5-aminoimidazole carboxamide ribotide isomerase
MQLIPAIDIRGGRCVRLLHGDFDAETAYDVDPRKLAKRYRELGAEWLHIVDLDGAASGEPVNQELIRAVAAASDLQIQLGGGIRSFENLVKVLDYADRVVVGSLAVTQPERVAAWIEEIGAARVTLGFDVRLTPEGVPHLTTHGWTRTETLTLADAVACYRDSGLRHVLCTDVSRDGALSGPNVELYAACVREWPRLEIQASGGIRDSADLDALAGSGVAAAISGKALLENRITDEEIRRFLPNA